MVGNVPSPHLHRLNLENPAERTLKTLKIGEIDLGEELLLVAEIGNNHEGDFARARELVQAAAQSGVQAVKFQTFKTELFIHPGQPQRVAQLKGYELSFDQFAELKELAHQLGLLFISTPLDLDSAEFILEIADAVKVGSGDNLHFPLLDRLSGQEKPVILSAGMIDAEQVEQLLARFSGPVALLHCVSAYPVAPEQANLGAIEDYRRRFQVPIGYSDHTLGLQACLAAVALGARILEKHFTLDKKTSDFRDHQLSADPEEMARLVREARQIEALVGPRRRVVQAPEQDLEPLVRRSVCARRSLEPGHLLEAEDLCWTRPSGGLASGDEAQILGRRLRVAVAAGDRLEPNWLI